ncbi:MAG TPA: ABC transporter permease, partial [Vicinamibacterales bacterium]|nr:ABC transporter permease [Vicinamibacterales bacterium]
MDWKARVTAAFATATEAPDPDVIEELAQHVRAMYEAARADGCSHEDADRRVAAQLDRWRLDAAALRHPRRRPTPVHPPAAVSASRFVGLVHDGRYAVRLLRRQSRFAALVISTMALGICASTVLFSVTYGVVLKPLPWPNADRLVLLEETRGGVAPRFGAFTNAAYLAWGEEATTVERLAAWSVVSMTLSGAGDPDRIRVVAASASLFPALGVRPLIGSVFEERHEHVTQVRDPDGAWAGVSVVMLSEGLWRRRFGADPGVIGRVVQLDGRSHAVVGVLPDGLAFPDRQAQAWVPFLVRPATGNFLSAFSAMATLRPGVTPAQAAAEATARGRFAPDTSLTTTAFFGNDGPIGISVTPLRDAVVADVRRPLIVLFIAVLLLFVTATANVASLQLARATTRRREVAIRAALGAGAARVTRQLLVESLLLALLGGAVGLLLAGLLHRALPSLLPAGFPRVDDLAVNATVVLFALVISMVAGVAFGVLPALQVRRLNLVESLAEDGAPAVGVGRRSRIAHPRMLIMAGQVAIACVLLVGASLLGRSFFAMLNADRGYDPAGILTARLSLPAPAYTPERRYAVMEALLARLAAVPGVTEAFTSEAPLTPGGSTTAFTMRSPRGEGAPVSVQASPRIVSPRAFAALGMRVLAGRAFSDMDTDTSMD